MLRKLSFRLILLVIALFVLPTVTNAETFNIHVENDQAYETLNGEWYFYHEQLLTAEDIEQRLAAGENGQLVSIPDSFENQVGMTNTYGTFATYVSIPSTLVGESLSIHNPFQNSAYRLFVDDQLIASNGVVGVDAVSHQTEMAPRMNSFEVQKEQFLVVMQLSSFEHIRGGFNNPIYIGTTDAVTKRYNNELFLQVFLIGGIFAIGLFIGMFVLLKNTLREYFWFALFCFGVAVRGLFIVPFVYTLTVFDLSWEWGTRLEYVTTIVTTMIYMILITKWYKGYYAKWIIWAEQAILFVLLVITLLTPPVIFQDWFFKLYSFIVLFIFYIFYMSVRSLLDRNKASIGNMMGLIIVAIAVVNEYIAGQLNVYKLPLTLLGMAIFIFIQAFIFSMNYIKAVKETERLNKELIQLNRSLDKKVAIRTQELEEVNERLYQQATHDELTGIHNRASFNSYLREQFMLAKKENKPLSILMLDLDEFKKYNDYYGHIAGDQLLIEVVQTIEGVLPDDVLFARYGGEEFSIVCPNTTSQQVEQIGQRIVEEVWDKQFIHEAREGGVATVSIGGATMLSGEFENECELVEVADQQLYNSKNSGRNKVTIRKMPTA